MGNFLARNRRYLGLTVIISVDNIWSKQNKTDKYNASPQLEFIMLLRQR